MNESGLRVAGASRRDEAAGFHVTDPPYKAHSGRRIYRYKKDYFLIWVEVAHPTTIIILK